MSAVFIVKPPGHPNGLKDVRSGRVFWWDRKIDAVTYLRDAFKKEIKDNNAGLGDWKTVWVERITDDDLL